MTVGKTMTNSKGDFKAPICPEISWYRGWMWYCKVTQIHVPEREYLEYSLGNKGIEVKSST